MPSNTAPSIEQELCRAARVASGFAYALRVEHLHGRTTLIVGWIAAGLEYKYREVELEDASGKVNEGALLEAIKAVV